MTDERDYVAECKAERAELIAIADRYVAAAMAELNGVSPLPGGGAWVWPFDAAPAELRALSDNGGDEDWLRLHSSRTAYAWEGVGEDPNRPVALCPACADEHHAHWDEMWSDYRSACGV